MPAFSAAAAAAVSTSGPRAVFTTIAVFFICVSRSALTKCFVSAVAGRCSESTSARAKRASISTFSTPAAFITSAVTYGS